MWKSIIGLLIGISVVAMAGCAESVEPYPFTDADVKEIKELVNSDMIANGYGTIDDENFQVICHNLAEYDWDWDATFEKAKTLYTTSVVDGISFGVFADTQVLIRLLDSTDGDGEEYYRSLGAGFCEHVD